MKLSNNMHIENTIKGKKKYIMYKLLKQTQITSEYLDAYDSLDDMILQEERPTRQRQAPKFMRKMAIV